MVSSVSASSDCSRSTIVRLEASQLRTGLSPSILRDPFDRGRLVSCKIMHIRFPSSDEERQAWTPEEGKPFCMRAAQFVQVYRLHANYHAVQCSLSKSSNHARRPMFMQLRGKVSLTGIHARRTEATFKWLQQTQSSNLSHLENHPLKGGVPEHLSSSEGA